MSPQRTRWFELSGRELRVLVVAAAVMITFMVGLEAVRQFFHTEEFVVRNSLQTLGPPTRIDINTAEAYELELLPGIGPKTAEAIIFDREKSGAYRHLEDLTRVNGIGNKTVESLRPHLMCRPPDGEAPGTEDRKR
jgi:competence ComEA-like helix-hairpin-helix protein